jgi:cysteine-rich secretory family protein
MSASDEGDRAGTHSMRFWNVCALAAALALSGCLGDEPLATGPVNPANLRALAAVHVDPSGAAAILTAYRASHGLGSVKLDPALTAMAQRQADAMVAANALSHDVGGNFTQRILASGLDTPRAAENLGGGYYSTEEAFAGWRNSPEHNANLLMPQATRFGIAIAKDPRTKLRVYWAMELAAEPDKPRNAMLMTHQ